MARSLEVFVPGALWLRDYVVSLGGARINARMTVIRLRSGQILIHFPPYVSVRRGVEQRGGGAELSGSVSLIHAYLDSPPLR